MPLNVGQFPNVRQLFLHEGDYCSSTVVAEREDGRQAAYVTSYYPAQPHSHAMADFSGPEEGVGISFKYRGRDKGAFLSLPFDCDREDAIRKKAFETYIRKHCDSWLEFASNQNLDVRRLEDIILVTGRDLTSSWAMATFVNSLNPEITLRVRASQAGSATFRWPVTSQIHHNEKDQVRQDLSHILPL